VAAAPGTSSLESPSPPENSPVSPRSPAADQAAADTDGGAAGAGRRRPSSAPAGTDLQSDSDGSASDGEAGGAGRKKRRDEQPGGGITRSRQPSDVSLAAKKLAQEEGAVHRLGTEVRRKMLERASAEAEKAEAAHAADGAVSGEAAEVTAAIIDAHGGNEKERRRSEEEEEEVGEHVRALKEKLRALKSGA
jgi:hypothetical protein